MDSSSESGDDEMQSVELTKKHEEGVILFEQMEMGFGNFFVFLPNCEFLCSGVDLEFPNPFFKG